MIKGLTPHYVTTPFVSPLTSETCTKYTLQLYVWNGLKSAVPSLPSYEVTITNPTSSTGNSKVNISRLVNDFIEFTPSTTFTSANLLDGKNQLWVQHNVIYFTSDVLDDDVKQNITTDLLVSGYGYGLEGENPTTPSNKILLTGDNFTINKNGFFNIPILIDESTAGQTATLTSFPSNTFSQTFSLPNTDDSSKIIQNIWVSPDSSIAHENYMEFNYNNTTITLFLEDECKYNPIDIAFQNKEGALQFVTFFKEKRDSISITSEKFESNRGQPSLGNHQFTRFNTQAKESFEANSGFIDESENEAFKQLLLSDRVWMYNGNYIPLNVSKNKLEYKTRLNDRLVNYNIDFEYAFNEINNI